MSLLDLNSGRGSSPRLKRGVKLWVGAGFVAAVVGIGSTLASSITINASSPSEFGQGVERIVYCGGDSAVLKVAPISSYRNLSGNTDSTAGNFFLSGIRVSDIPTACDKTNFVISLYPSNGSSTPITVISGSGKNVNTFAVYWRNSLGSSEVYQGQLSSEALKSSASSTCQNLVTSNTYMSSGTSGALLSLSRTAYDSPCKYAYLTVLASGTKDAFQINFKRSSDDSDLTNTDIKDAGRIIIETQEDTFGQPTGSVANALKSATNSSGLLGLARDGLS